MEKKCSNKQPTSNYDFGTAYKPYYKSIIKLKKGEHYWHLPCCCKICCYCGDMCAYVIKCKCCPCCKPEQEAFFGFCDYCKFVGTELKKFFCCKKN